MNTLFGIGCQFVKLNVKVDCNRCHIPYNAVHVITVKEFKSYRRLAYTKIWYSNLQESGPREDRRFDRGLESMTMTSNEPIVPGRRLIQGKSNVHGSDTCFMSPDVFN